MYCVIAAFNMSCLSTMRSNHSAICSLQYINLLKRFKTHSNDAYRAFFALGCEEVIHSINCRNLDLFANNLLVLLRVVGGGQSVGWLSAIF